MADWSATAIGQLRAGLRALADPERAADMRSYMKDRFAFHGVRAPERRHVARRVFASVGPAPDEAALLTLADRCWEQPEREYQYIAVDALARWVESIEPTALPALRRLITTKSWWDTVDPLASQVVGELALRFPEIAGQMDRWIDDPDVWIVRTAILHQLRWKDATDAERLFSYCRRQAPDPDFFVRKAIGWALRQYARVDPGAVAAFVDATPELSSLSRREALKHVR